MVLSRGDEYPIHQTAEPVAYSGTDRNFYDRYFFNGYAPDGRGFFAAALGVYPHLDIIDAHFTVVRDGVQHCVHASAELGMERMAMAVGPISIEIVEALNVLRLRVEPFEGVAADITFTGRAFPIEEPRFTHRIGPRAFMDYTRMTQNGRYAGWIEVDGEKHDLAAGRRARPAAHARCAASRLFLAVDADQFPRRQPVLPRQQRPARQGVEHPRRMGRGGRGRGRGCRRARQHAYPA